MVKVTPHENLVRDTRDGWVNDHPNHDFINNRILAQKFIRAMAQFYHLRQGSAIFSGYIRESAKEPFRFKLWHEGKVVRSLKVTGIGYSGFLHAEIVGEFEEAVGWDMLGSLALDSRQSLAIAAQL